MAKAAWCSASPTSGSGNGSVSIGADVFTGRTQRQTTVTFSAAGVTDQTVAVTQKAAAEFVTFDNISAPNAGGNVTLQGTSNSALLTFSLGTGDIVVSLPATYLAGGASTNNGVAIAGDPGASGSYNFSITLNVPANTTTGSLTKIVTVTAQGGQSASATITQAAGDPYLTVDPTSLLLEADGTAQSVTVSSNTNWTVA